MVTRITKGILKEYIVGPSRDISMINSFLSTLKRDMGPMSKMKYLMKSLQNNWLLAEYQKYLPNMRFGWLIFKINNKANYSLLQIIYSFLKFSKMKKQSESKVCSYQRECTKYQEVVATYRLYMSRSTLYQGLLHFCNFEN